MVCITHIPAPAFDTSCAPLTNSTHLKGIEQTIQQSPAAGPVPSGYDISLNSHEQFRSQTSLHDGQISMDTPHMINIPGHETRTEESPLGIEFGEFFLETDMAFLNTDI